MNDDELRARLARLDPQAASPVDQITSPRAQDLLERTMTTTDQTPSTEAPGAPGRRRNLTAVAAGLVAVAGIAAAVVMNQGSSTPTHGKTTHPKTTLALKAPAAARPGMMNSCIRFTVDQLKTEPVAFAGTVTDVQPGTVTLDVTKWFKGGTADQVTVTTPDRTANVELEGVEFTQGASFLVSAFDGTVVSCGYSGPDETTLRLAYEEAFGG